MTGRGPTPEGERTTKGAPPARAGLELLVTCEHGGNRVPEEYAPLFAGAAELLESHRGFDAGALDVARALAARLGARLIAAETTRLLVDLNRSPRHPRLFSELTRGLPPERKRTLLADHYAPYRQAVESVVAAAAGAGRFLLHVSSHSFVPVLDGVERKAEIGLLFDPRRPAEASFAAAWRSALRKAAPAWSVRRNYPYRGVADGLTTHLRRRFADAAYAGLELEVNQRLVTDPAWTAHVKTIAAALGRAVDELRAMPCAGKVRSPKMPRTPPMRRSSTPKVR
ncbi:MAG TPA: N-formylglutamate amidohydrolase [Gammaproteobacteria bacterium]